MSFFEIDLNSKYNLCMLLLKFSTRERKMQFEKAPSQNWAKWDGIRMLASFEQEKFRTLESCLMETGYFWFLNLQMSMIQWFWSSMEYCNSACKIWPIEWFSFYDFHSLFFKQNKNEQNFDILRSLFIFIEKIEYSKFIWKSFWFHYFLINIKIIGSWLDHLFFI